MIHSEWPRHLDRGQVEPHLFRGPKALIAGPALLVARFLLGIPGKFEYVLGIER